MSDTAMQEVTIKAEAEWDTEMEGGRDLVSVDIKQEPLEADEGTDTLVEVELVPVEGGEEGVGGEHHYYDVTLKHEPQYHDEIKVKIETCDEPASPSPSPRGSGEGEHMYPVVLLQTEGDEAPPKPKSLRPPRRSESTKASTTEVQTITSRKMKKTNAQRCREYRERKKLQITMEQNITAERSDECSEADQLPAKKPKTDAERRKKYYEAQKLKKQKSKKIPKTAKQRNKECYDRKKKFRLLTF